MATKLARCSLDDVTQQRLLANRFEKEKQLRLHLWQQRQSSTGQDSGSSDGVTRDSLPQPSSINRQYDAACRKLQLKQVQVPEALLNLRDVERATIDFRRRRPKPVLTAASPLLPPLSANDRCDGDHGDHPFMVPADETVRRELYDQGRAGYLVRRSQRRPESRYRFPLLSSWAYGWNIRDVIPMDDRREKAENKRRNLVQDTFYARNGVNLNSL